MSVTQAIVALLMGLKVTNQSPPTNHRRVFREFGTHLQRIATKPDPAGRRKKPRRARRS